MSKREVPVKKNQTITLEFEDLTHEGSGVGKVNGYPLFVPHALPDEKATVKVIKVNKRFGYGKLLEVLDESPERVQPEHQCGGCPLQHMRDRKSTRLNSSHVAISYAVFSCKKKT